VIELTARARALLRTASDSARRFDPEARIRLSVVGTELRSGFAHEPETDDEVLEDGDVVLFVDAALDGIVDVIEPHDRLVLRPRGGG
jgi:hypothetical protein